MTSETTDKYERVSMEVYKKLQHIEIEINDLKQYIIRHQGSLDKL